MNSRNFAADPSAASLIPVGSPAGRTASTSNNAATRNRQAELAAAFNSDSDGEDSDSEPILGRDSLPGYGASPPPRRNRRSGRQVNVTIDSEDGNNDIFFDAGDAMGPVPAQAPPAPRRIVTGGTDPLANTPAPTPISSTSRGARRPVAGAYDFERPAYFPARSGTSAYAPDPNRPSSIAGPSVGHHPASGSSLEPPAHQQPMLGRARLALGRFGRFVGMRVPGATYASLSQDDGAGPDGTSRRNRPVMGGGIGQDGVFANLNAKPERRRRRRADDGEEDRGEDDDLEESALPPTYDVAAADSAPPYWETAIIGGPAGLGGVHPLAPGGMGWTPGGTHVGAIEDLIVDGLPVGNFFGFAWNLLVSMTFQFVGFLLTYLLHTTHAAKTGSRAGLGITLIQYGLYLRTRAQEIADGEGRNAGTDYGLDGGGARRRQGWVESNTISRDVSTSTPAAPTTSTGMNLADALAGSAAGPNGSTSLASSVSASTEWLSYLLMIVGWFILLSSLLSYWRVWRWGASLVVAARQQQQRDADGTAGDPSTGAAADGSSGTSGGTSLVSRFRAAFGSNSSSRSTNERSGEDWVVFPGLGHRLGAGLNDEVDRSAEEGERGAEGNGAGGEERRLIEQMRGAGLIE